MKIYIILGLTPQGLAVLRELGKAGAEVIAFCTSTRNVGYHSRYGKKICYKSISELQNYVRQIVEENDEKPICYITSGEILASVLREYKELYEACDVYSGPFPIIELLAHKDRMYELAAGKGFEIAKYATLDKYKDGCLTFPIFLKRNYEIPLFFKVMKVNTQEELDSYVKRIPLETLKDVIAQEYIDIPNCSLINISCQGFFVDGECAGIYIANQTRRLRKGITSYIEEITDKRLCRFVENLVLDFMKELKYRGFAELEFMYDEDKNKLYFIEINTRTCGSQSSMNHKFSNLADIILNPQEFVILQSAQCPLHWMNIQRDIRARLESRDWSHLGNVFHSKYDILDWKDLIPFIRQFI